MIPESAGCRSGSEDVDSGRCVQFIYPKSTFLNCPQSWTQMQTHYLSHPTGLQNI